MLAFLYITYITYITAAALEVSGLAVTVIDIRAAQRRLGAYFSRPINLYVTDTLHSSDAQEVTLMTTGGEPPTPEQRIDALERWQRTVAGELDQRDERLRAQIGSRIESEVSGARDSLNDRLEGLREYVVGEPQRRWWGRIYRGPLFFFGGVFLGLGGNLVALAAQPGL
jgi:hypothetical protein